MTMIYSSYYMVYEDFIFSLKDRSAIYLVGKKNNEKCPSPSNFYR